MKDRFTCEPWVAYFFGLSFGAREGGMAGRDPIVFSLAILLAIYERRLA